MTEPPEPPRHNVAALYSQPVERADADAVPVETLPCEVCGARDALPVYVLPATPWRLVRCRGCDLGSLFPRPTAAEVAAFYPPEYYGSGGRKFAGLIEMLVRLVGSRHARFLARLVGRGARVLDVGCGRGVTLGALADAGCDVHGFEISADAVRGLDPRIQVHVADSLAAAGFAEQSFDEVILWHVLEHVPEPRRMLEEIHRILRPGGVLVVAVPNASSWQARWAGPAWFHLDPPRHLFHFPVATLRRLLESLGFHCESAHHFSLRQNPFGWIQSALNRIGWWPRNSLYALLHRRRSGAAGAPTPPWPTRALLYALFMLLSPVALLLSVAAAVCRSGATVHLVARKAAGSGDS